MLKLLLVKAEFSLSLDNFYYSKFKLFYIVDRKQPQLMKQNIIIRDKEISFLLIDGVEYFNLTEIGSLDEESRDDLVRSWMRNRLTLESLIVWEQMFNPHFKGDALDTFRKEAFKKKKI